MQRLFIAIIISTCAVLPAGAQSFSYYPADADHVFLWSDESPEAIRAERVRGKWSLEGTPLRNGKWPSLLARAVKSSDHKDASAALDDMVAGEADKSVAVLRLPNAHALFIKRGDARLLLIGNTSTTTIEVTFDKTETGWTKGKANVPLGSWLGTKDEIKAGEMLRGMFASAPSPSNNNWPPFWNAIATEAVASTGCRAITYGHTPAPEWLLVELSDGAATVVDRVHRYTPPAHRVVVIVKEKVLIPGTEMPGAAILLVLAGTAGLGILAGLAIALVLPWFLWRKKPSLQRLIGRGDDDTGEDAGDGELSNDLERSSGATIDNDVAQLIEELRPAIGAAFTRRASRSARAKDTIASAEFDARLQVISAAAAECSQLSPQYFGDLALERPRDSTWHDRFAERLKKCVQSAQQALETSATNLKAANAELVNTDRENEKLQKERDAAVKRNDQLKTKVASAEKLEEMVATLTKERDDLQKSMEKERARADRLGTDSETRQKQFETDRASWGRERTQWEARISDSRKDLDHIQQSLGTLGRLSELLQGGLMNHYSREDDGPAAAMLGFLANHSLTQLNFAIAAGREPQQRYMLLNLETICRSFPDLRGYKNAKIEIEQHFGNQRPPAEAEIQRANLRAEASIFQFTLRYLQKTSRDLNAYYFFVDDNGLPYRAQA